MIKPRTIKCKSFSLIHLVIIGFFLIEIEYHYTQFPIPRLKTQLSMRRIFYLRINNIIFSIIVFLERKCAVFQIQECHS
ncbi:unknown [Coraliomargarita sp. CAG:312]|nr:unknown [Coraliomargarita sp. CAG:312]